MKTDRTDRPNIYDILASEYESSIARSPFYRDQRRCELEMLNRYAADPPSNAKALDVGCGPGFGSSYLAARGFNVVAVDDSPEMRNIACRNLAAAGAQFEIVDSDATEIEGLGGHFDAVISFGSVINHLPGEDELDAFVRGVSSNLSQGGVALLGADNLLSVDSMGWLIGAALERAGFGAELKDVVRRLSAAMRGKVHHNHWCLVSSRGTLRLPLSYYPRATLVAAFHRHQLAVIDEKGSNILASLFPGYLASSEFDPRATASLSLPSRVGSWLDAKLGRLLSRVATYNIFVLRKNR